MGNNMVFSTFRLVTFGLSFFACSSALACPEGQYEVCTGFCYCVPNSGQVIKEVTHPIQEAVTQLTAPALQEWIVQSHNSAASGGTLPIPQDIRMQMQRYYDDRVLSKARYKVGDNGILNAAHTMFQSPDVNAVTLIDIIVFRFPNDALYSAPLWAHELKHVQQYLDWGVRDFAINYTRNYNDVEAPAYAIQDIVARSPVTSVVQFPSQVSQIGGFPSGYGMKVCGCWGYNPAPIEPEPRCQSGNVRINACPGFCPTGGSPYAYICQ
jgi:hypothetical protein